MDSEGQTAHLFVGFNRDGTSLQIGKHDGYTIYSLEDVKPKIVYNEKGDEGARYIERLFSSSLVAYTLHKSPRKLRIFHFGRQQRVCTQTYSNTVVAIKMNRECIIICLEDSLIIHNFADLKIKHQIRDIPENKKGVFDVTPEPPEKRVSLIAYPGSAETGRVMLFDLKNLAPASSISAHSSALSALRFNFNGTLLATSSIKGTVIRIFNVLTGERLFEFTRGVKRYVTVNSLAFSNDSKYVCLSSNTETVHVFKLEKTVEEAQTQQEDATWAQYLTKAASSYLPTQMNELFYREKSFATARLPIAGPKNAAALRIINGQPNLLVATVDGYFYRYYVDLKGGECTLISQSKTGNQVDEKSNDDEVCSLPTGLPDEIMEDEAHHKYTNEFPALDHSVE